jgi:hypothetical protein
MSASVLRSGRDEDHREQRRERDRHPRRPPVREHLGEHARHDPLRRHPVEQPRRHDHVDQRAVGDREQRDRREELRVDRERPELYDLEQRAVGGRELLGRHGHARDDADREVDEAGDEQPAEQRARVVALRLARLLGDVDRVLEADHRVEREARARHDGGQERLALLDLERAARVADAVEQRGGADQDDEHEPAELDEGEPDVHLHALADPARVDRRDESRKQNATATVGTDTNSAR